MTKKDIAKYKRLESAYRKAEKAFVSFRSSVARVCVHPREMIEDFAWEWDSGYGRQEMQMGRRCRVCMKENKWPDPARMDELFPSL